MGQRCIREDRLAYVIEHGKVYNRAGATWYVMRLKDIPEAERSIDSIRKLDGIVVCVQDDEVKTVYHNDRPSTHIRKKSKHDIRRTNRGEPETAA